MNRVDRIVLDPNRTYACTRTARTSVRVTVAHKENLDEMLASGVIERSDAAYYSHPVIVTKSPGKFRTCIDCRPLNKCLTPAVMVQDLVPHSYPP